MNPTSVGGWNDDMSATLPNGPSTVSDFGAQMFYPATAAPMDGMAMGIGSIPHVGVEGENSDDYWNALIDGESLESELHARVCKLTM